MGMLVEEGGDGEHLGGHAPQESHFSGVKWMYRMCQVVFLCPQQHTLAPLLVSSPSSPPAVFPWVCSTGKSLKQTHRCVNVHIHLLCWKLFQMQQLKVCIEFSTLTHCSWMHLFVGHVEACLAQRSDYLNRIKVGPPRWLSEDQQSWKFSASPSCYLLLFLETMILIGQFIFNVRVCQCGIGE